MKQPQRYSDLSQREQGANRWQILGWLVHHPFLSAEQLSQWRETPLRTTQWHLRRLLKEGWIVSVNYQHPDRLGRRPTPLYALTPKALEFLRPAEFSTWQEYAHARDYQRPRLERLWLAMGRVIAVRQFLFSTVWRRLGWAVDRWDEEISFPYYPYGRLVRGEESPLKVPLAGGVLLQGVEGGPRAGHYLPLALEFDQGRVPVAATRDRWSQLTLAQDDPRFYDEGENRFPILVVVARDRARFIEFVEALFNGMRPGSGGVQPLLRAFMTTSDYLVEFQQDPGAAVWWSVEKGEWTTLFDGIVGAACELEPYWVREPPRRSKPCSQVTLCTSEAQVAQPPAALARRHSLSDLAQLALSLPPLEKMLLYMIGSHPLLAANELAVLLDTDAKYVEPALAGLEALALVQKLAAPMRRPRRTRERRRKRREPTHAYVLADRGVRYLAAVDGFGRQVHRYVQARGWALHLRSWEHVPLVNEAHHRDWGRVFGVQVLHWEHTRAENALLLQFHKVALHRRDQLSWLSEQEGRLYYEHQIRSSDYLPRMRKPKRSSTPNRTRRGHHWHDFRRRRRPRPYFMPDGRGVYTTADERYPFVVEVDRTHVRFSNIVDKLRRYCLSLEQEKGGFDGYRLLIITTGWKRAHRLAQLVQNVGLSRVADDDLPKLTAAERHHILETDILPTFITTFRELRKKRIDQPIWLDALHGRMGTYCLDCFAKKDGRPSSGHEASNEPPTDAPIPTTRGAEVSTPKQRDGSSGERESNGSG